MSKDDYAITTSQTLSNTITDDEWLIFAKKLEQLGVNKEALELIQSLIKISYHN